MKRTTLFAVALLAIVAFSAGSVLAADPTLTEVYRAAETGNLKQAEGMMDQVLKDHPNSAKAHFVEAEILAKEGKLEMSRAELGTAERLAPGLPFAKPGAVSELTQRLNATVARQAPSAAPMSVTAAAPASSFPWGLLLVGLALFAAAIYFFRNLNRPRVYPAGPNYSPASAGYGPGGYPQQTYGPGMGPVGPMGGGGIGSGILGGLATGAAVGAGMVAGEALMHEVFGGGNAHAAEAPRLAPNNDYQPLPDANYDLGGNDFGVSDAGSWDDASAAGGGSDDWG
jgi:hypothetical protein